MMRSSQMRDIEEHNGLCKDGCLKDDQEFHVWGSRHNHGWRARTHIRAGSHFQSGSAVYSKDYP